MQLPIPNCCVGRFAGCGPCGRSQPTDIYKHHCGGQTVADKTIITYKGCGRPQGPHPANVPRFNNNYIQGLRTATRAAPCKRTPISIIRDKRKLLLVPDHRQAELLLQHAGVEDTHVVVHDREGQHVTVGTLAEARQ